MALTKIGASLGGGADTVFITQAGHGLTLGYPVKANGNGTYAHATADTAANAEAIGIIIESTTNTMLIALSGRITVDGCVPNLSAGTVLFLQVSAGLLAAAEPSGNNQVSKPMAVITYANSEMILLSHRGEVISTAGITLADGSVDNDAMADDAIGADELAANAVVNASIASGAAIDATKIADGSVTSTEFQYINTLSSNAQTQISAKQATIDSSARLDASLIGANGNISNAEYGYLDGVTSSIQTQIDAAGGDFSNGGDNGALVLGTNDANSLTLETTNTARMVIAAAGDVTVSTGNVVIGTAGKGIDFSAQTLSTQRLSQSGGEVLDHYEEGTFTPHLFDDDRDVSTATYGYRPANYTRIGNRVWFSISWNWESLGNLTTGDNVKIGGLPFTSSSNPTVNIRHACSIGMVGSLSIGVSNAAWFQVRVDGNRSDADVTYTTYGGTSFNQQYIKLSDLSANGVLDISGSYEVA